MKTQLGFTITELILVVVVLGGGFGWVWNIVKIAGACCGLVDGMFVLRVVGIFIAPLGAILGYI